ncbi:MAG: putative Ig domain-containing protein [Candidatus Omnitrophica bacterium]|nr:putative Ig domain-containing protein [Candidatus Omnitrophota bacterium]
MNPRSIAVSGDYAYVASRSNNTLVIYDIADPAKFLKVSATPTCFDGTQVVLDGSRLFLVCNNNGVTDIFDVSSPIAPKKLGVVNTFSRGNPVAAKVVGSYLYVADMNYLTDQGTLLMFLVYDVSKPATPVLVGTVQKPSPTIAMALDVSGNYAYVYASTYSIKDNRVYPALFVIDIANPRAPVIRSIFEVGTYGPFGVQVRGSRAYVVDGKALFVVDIANPLALRLLASLPTTSTSLFLLEPHLYTLTAESTVEVFDISIASAPRLITSITLPPIQGSAVLSITLPSARVFTAGWGSITAALLPAVPEPPAPTPNQPPTLDVIGNKSVAEGSTVAFTINGHDPEGGVVTYAASGLPQGASFNPATRLFSWTPSYTQAGRYTVTCTATDPEGLTASQTSTITVTNVNRPPVLAPIGNKTVELRQTVNVTISATDPDGDALTYKTSVLPPGASFDAATRTFRWTPTSPSVFVGRHSVTFTVSDGALTDGEIIWILVNPSTSSINDPPQIYAASVYPSRTVKVGQRAFVWFAAYDPNPDTLTMTLSGVPVGATALSGYAVSYSWGAYNYRWFYWTPTAAQVGTQTIRADVTDGRGGTVSREVTATVVK